MGFEGLKIRNFSEKALQKYNLKDGLSNLIR